MCALCWGARLHARVGDAEVNRCAALCKPGLGLVTHPRSVMSAPSRNPASSARLRVFLHFFHPLPLTVCATRDSD